MIRCEMSYEWCYTGRRNRYFLRLPGHVYPLSGIYLGDTRGEAVRSLGQLNLKRAEMGLPLLAARNCKECGGPAPGDFCSSACQVDHTESNR